MIFLFVFNFLAHVPPAAKTLSVMVAVYSIMTAAKKNDWICTHVNGWKAVAFNLLFTTIGLLIVVPEGSLYSVNTLTLLVVGLLGSSGIHGMVKSIPPSNKGV